MNYLVSHRQNGTAVFAVKGDEAVNLTDPDASVGQDLMALISTPGLAESVAARIDGAPKVSIASITPALPVANPGAIICLGLNYTDHIKEGGDEIPEYPAFFMRSRKSIMAAGAPSARPACSDKLDYEAELIVSIGKGGRHISGGDALDHVALVAAQ